MAVPDATVPGAAGTDTAVPPASAPRRTSAWLQLSAERYWSRRLENALRCGAPERDAPRAAFLAGCGVAAALLAGCVLLAAVTPAPTPGDALIVLDRQAGALYVRFDETLHPVPNLTSARLITGTDAAPRPVDPQAIHRARRGEPLGIAGAPRSLGPVLPPDTVWSLCSGETGSGELGARRSVTTVLADRSGGGAQDLDGASGAAIAVTADGHTLHLLRGGRRMAAGRLDRPGTDVPVPVPADAAVLPVSPRLLAALPAAPGAPAVPDDAPPGLAGAQASPRRSTVCVHWRPRADGTVAASTTAGDGLPIPAGEDVVPLAGNAAQGFDAVDAVYLPPGHCGYVRAAGEDGALIGPGYLIDDTGTRFVVADDAAHRLGLPDRAAPVPWPVLAGLPTGPELSRDAALDGRNAGAPGAAAPG